MLTLLERVTKEHIQNIPESLANELVTLGSSELTAVQVSVTESSACLCVCVCVCVVCVLVCLYMCVSVCVSVYVCVGVLNN